MTTAIKELEYEYSLKYEDLCNHLKRKYGLIDEPYFLNEKCRTVNHSIKRTEEGLFIHHTKENEYILLANTDYAIKAPFEYQEGRNLVYCNYFEHMFLHIAIVKEFLKLKTVEKTKMAVGIGGLINYIFPEIIDYLNGYEYKKEYLKTALSVVDGNEMFFVKVLFEFQNLLKEPELSSIAIRTFWPKKIDIFNGKMTSSGRFVDLVNEYAFSNAVFKFDNFQEIKEKIDVILSHKPTKASIGWNHNHRGDNCLYYFYYHLKKEESKTIWFRLYPSTLVEVLKETISEYEKNNKRH